MPPPWPALRVTLPASRRQRVPDTMPWNLADAARRYEAGESLAQIAQALDTPPTTVYRRLLAGGLPPRETAPWGARRGGARNYTRERARHDAIAPEKQRAIHELL